jgi:predicted anti-sigma-YlaC factor YlaD
MTLNHHRAGHLLSAYLDGELSRAEAAAVQEHLMDCAVCREQYEHLRTTKGLLGQLPLAEPSAEFWSLVREVPGRSSPVRSSWTGPALFRRPAWALAAVLVALALAAVPLIKGTADRLHATEIGVDLYVREHAIEMSTEPLTDRAYLSLVAGDAEMVLVGENPRAGQKGP